MAKQTTNQVISQSSVLLKMLQNGLSFNGEVVPQCPAQTALVEACVQGGMMVEGRLLTDSANQAFQARDLKKLKLLRKANSGKQLLISGAIHKLDRACEIGDVNSVELLLAAGTPVNSRDAYYNTPLHLTSQEKKNHEQQWKCALIARTLIEANAQLDAKNRVGNTPLANAVLHGNLEIAEVLLGAKSDPRAEGFELLHIAAEKGDAKMVKLLMKYKAEVNAVNKDGKSVLLSAAYYGHRAVAEQLLEARASVNTREDLLGRTALGVAMEAQKRYPGRQAVAALLKKWGGTTWPRTKRVQLLRWDAELASSNSHRSQVVP